MLVDGEFVDTVTGIPDPPTEIVGLHAPGWRARSRSLRGGYGVVGGVGQYENVSDGLRPGPEGITLSLAERIG